MGPHSEGTEPLLRASESALGNPHVQACLGAWLAVLSVGMAALWFSAPERGVLDHTGVREAARQAQRTDAQGTDAQRTGTP